ncbi:MAG TPA: hypothetical protein VGG04_06380 [Candidatus Sulfotelmatobacter sp.]|jgi:hypothetical protein
MTSTRNFAYAALLAAAALNFAPTPASAQEPVHGRFTLTHDVNWGKAKVPAGDYAFSFDRNAVSPVLNLSKLNGARIGFMVLVPATEDTRTTDASRLLLESTAGGSYVSALQLPEFGMTLRFDVPHVVEKQIAKAGIGAAGSGQ